MSPKQTLYEVLAVSPTATAQEIQDAYQQRWNSLQLEKDELSSEDFNFRQQLLKLARSTLSNADERSYYDTKLANTVAPDNADRKTNAVTVSTNNDNLSRRADTLALHADALALRAQAMAIRAGLPDGALPQSSGVKSTIKRTVVIVGTVVATLMVIQLIFMSFAARMQEGAAKAEEKVAIEDYYRANGVRPANITELHRLEAENRRKASEESAAERAVQKEEYEKRQAEEEYRRSREDVKRLADQVTYDLNRSAEAARIEEAEAAARKQRQVEEEAQRKEDAENLRLRRLNEKWQRSLAE